MSFGGITRRPMAHRERKLDTRMAALDPVTLTWTPMNYSGKSDFHAEEGWTLLPDGTVLTTDIPNAPNSEKYIPWLQTWVTAGKHNR